MGNSHPTESTLDLSESFIDELKSKTVFDEEEIQYLWKRFQKIGNTLTADGLIDRAEFEQSLGYANPNALVAHRLFHIFDQDGNGTINFQEFIAGLSMICSDDQEAKIAFSFRLYDVDDNKYIDKEELLQLLKAVLYDTYLIDLSYKDLKDLVDNTFEETDSNGDGKIDLEEYRQLVLKYPNIVKNFTIDRSVLRSSPV